MREKFAVLLLTLLAWAAPAAAQPDGCLQYSWSYGREIDLFADGYLPTIDSASSLPKEGVFALRLKATSDIMYPVPPDRGRDSGYGGYVTLESIPAGRYHIVLSEDAWVDAVEEHARLPVRDSGKIDNCPSVRQSVQFEVTGQPLTIQISGAPVDHLSIAVVRVWNFERKK